MLHQTEQIRVQIRILRQIIDVAQLKPAQITATIDNAVVTRGVAQTQIIVVVAVL